MDIHWKRLGRKTVLNTKFLKVYEDTVELPNGNIIDDYSVVEKGSFVMVVATDLSGHVIVLREYKYAVDTFLLSLPAGLIESNESVTESARRELEEETGATGGTFEEVGILYDYPSKDMHSAHIVRATGVTISVQPHHEQTELIEFEAIPIDQIKQQILNKEWQASAAIAALTISGILF